MSRFATQGTHGLLLEAEVAPAAQVNFEARYLAATGRVISPGTPKYYQNQFNKWGLSQESILTTQEWPPRCSALSQRWNTVVEAIYRTHIAIE